MPQFEAKKILIDRRGCTGLVREEKSKCFTGLIYRHISRYFQNWQKTEIFHYPDTQLYTPQKQMKMYVTQSGKKDSSTGCRRKSRSNEGSWKALQEELTTSLEQFDELMSL